MRYLIIFFVILVSCNSNKTKTEDSTQEVLTEKTDSVKIQSDKESSKVDSVHIDKIDFLVDSILMHRDYYKLITRHQLDGDCYGLDSLYFDKNNRLIIFIGSSGCSADESSFVSIYNSAGLIYYNLIEGGDGLVNNDSKMYYKKNEPIFGFQKNYEWDWETRTLADSSSKILSNEELVDISKFKMSLDKRLGNVIDRMKELNPKMSYDNKYKFVDTIQQVMEERYYLIDSIDYVDRIK